MKMQGISLCSISIILPDLIAYTMKYIKFIKFIKKQLTNQQKYAILYSLLSQQMIQ